MPFNAPTIQYKYRFFRPDNSIGTENITTDNSGNITVSGTSFVSNNDVNIASGVLKIGGTTLSDASRNITAGVIISGSNASLPAQGGYGAYITGGYSSPTSGKLIIGDGTGWNYYISKLISSIITDLYKFADNGYLDLLSGGLKVAGTTRIDSSGNAVFGSATINGNILCTATGYVTNIAPYTGTNTSLQLYANGTGSIVCNNPLSLTSQITSTKTLGPANASATDPASTDSIFNLYNYGSTNWAGWGVDGGGQPWFCNYNGGSIRKYLFGSACTLPVNTTINGTLKNVGTHTISSSGRAMQIGDSSNYYQSSIYFTGASDYWRVFNYSDYTTANTLTFSPLGSNRPILITNLSYDPLFTFDTATGQFWAKYNVSLGPNGDGRLLLDTYSTAGITRIDGFGWGRDMSLFTRKSGTGAENTDQIRLKADGTINIGASGANQTVTIYSSSSGRTLKLYTDAATTGYFGIESAGAGANAYVGSVDENVILKPNASKSISLNGKVALSSTDIWPSAASQTIPSSTSLTRMTGANATYTVSATPSITDGLNVGQTLIIANSGDTYSLTLQEAANLTGSKIHSKNNSNITIGPRQTATFVWDGTYWLEV